MSCPYCTTDMNHLEAIKSDAFTLVYLNPETKMIQVKIYTSPYSRLIYKSCSFEVTHCPICGREL